MAKRNLFYAQSGGVTAVVHLGVIDDELVLHGPPRVHPRHRHEGAVRRKPPLAPADGVLGQAGGGQVGMHGAPA